jgi:DNA-directed RNA polymerase specialized sigma24 family protein
VIKEVGGRARRDVETALLASLSGFGSLEMVKIIDERSVTGWIASLKSGDQSAPGRLWQRYFEPLVRVARNRLGRAPRAVADEEDAALSAFESFCRGATGGRYPKLDDRNDLWRLLVVITERKAIDQVQRQRQKKRGGGKVIGTLSPSDLDGHVGEYDAVTAPDQSPELIAMVADECQSLLANLRDDTLREVANLRLEGFTSDEIAGQLGCSVRSVARKLDLIRRSWLADDETDKWATK